MNLAEGFWQKNVLPTKVYADAAVSNQVHWRETAWNYDFVTANMVYANQQAILPRVLMRQPKVIVKPATRLTRTFARVGEASPTDRFLAAALVGQIVNWRLREFDFTKQIRRCVRDDHDRGIGFAQHGFIGIGDKARTDGKGSIEFLTHKHLREGWPFVVHRNVDEVRWDQRAREVDERRWAAFKRLWLPKDLKAYFGLRMDPPVTEVLGSDMYDTLVERQKFEKVNGDSVGYTGVWEIWDRRTNEIIYWLDKQEEDLAVEDWPLEFEGLPDSVLMTNEMNDRILPIPEPSMYWELQQDLNRMLALVLVYAKRGVPLVGVDINSIHDEDVEKITDAEILEIIRTKGDPNAALSLLALSPVPQTLLLAIQMTEGFIRQISGVGKMQQGTRENVDTATEAAEIGQGGDMRAAMRAEAVRKFFAEVVRKDWQVFQQNVQEDQIIDIVAQGLPPELVKVTREQMRLEFDFDIQVGSSEPLNEGAEQRKALAFVAAMQSDPEVRTHANPRFMALQICRAFGFDESEAMAPMEAAIQQGQVDKEIELQSGGTSAGAGTNLAGALDAMKSRPDNRDQAKPGRTS